MRRRPSAEKVPYRASGPRVRFVATDALVVRALNGDAAGLATHEAEQLGVLADGVTDRLRHVAKVMGMPQARMEWRSVKLAEPIARGVFA